MQQVQLTVRCGQREAHRVVRYPIAIQTAVVSEYQHAETWPEIGMSIGALAYPQLDPARCMLTVRLNGVAGRAGQYG